MTGYMTKDNETRVCHCDAQQDGTHRVEGRVPDQ